MGGPTYRKLSDDSRHDFQNFSVTSVGYIAVIIDKNCIEESRDDVCSNHFKIISLLNISFDQLQDLLLDCSQTSNSRHLGGNFTLES